MEKIIVDLEVKSDKGVKEVKKLNKEISKTGKEVTNTKKEMKETNKETTALGAGAVGAFNKFKTSVLGVVKGFKSLRFAIIATGIGALLVGILAVKTAFTSSEKGQNKFAKLMGVIGSITGNLVDLLANLGEGIISVFENPKQALIDFKNLIIENVTNRFESIIDTIGFLGSAFKKVFSGDFSGALEEAKKAGSSYVDSLTGVKDSIDKVTESTKGFVKELKNEAKIAGNIADQRAKADKLERNLITERSEANRKRAELLDKVADKEKFSAKERIEFLKEAGRVEEEITEKEIILARLRLEAKTAENALSKSTKQDLTDEANLKARLIDLETARLTKAKLVTAQITGARREQQALESSDAKAKEDEQKAKDDDKILKDKEKTDKEIASAKSLSDLKNQIRNAEAISEDEKRALEIIKVTEHYNKLIELATLNGLSTVDLQKAKSNAISNISKVTSNNEIKWEKLTQDQKGAIVSQGLSNLSNILGKESAVGKAAAIASATIDTYQSATASYNSLAGIPIIGPALGFAAAGAAIASGVKTVKQISSTKIPKGGGGGSAPSISGGGGSAPSIPSVPPAFNVVGQSDTNQLADAIGGQSQQPTRAYVVSDDVTTAQSMDRNIIDGASI